MNTKNVLLVGALIASSSSAQSFSEYEYEPDRIYPVLTALGITTQIELSPDDKVLDFSTGFATGWDLIRRNNVFYLKPRNVDVDTNMVIRTERRSYVFELKVVASDWTALDQAKKAGAQYRITFRYPNVSEAVAIEPKRTTELRTTLDKGRVYNFRYDYRTRDEARWLVPSAVYDDGQFTYLRLADRPGTPTGGFPVVFARERERGEDLIVNTTVENGMLVVHGIYPYLVIRHGKNAVGLRRGQL